MVGILVIQQPYPKSLSYWYTITSTLWRFVCSQHCCQIQHFAMLGFVVMFWVMLSCRLLTCHCHAGASHSTLATVLVFKLLMLRCQKVCHLLAHLHHCRVGAYHSTQPQHENNAITLLYTNWLWLKHHDDPSIPNFYSFQDILKIPVKSMANPGDFQNIQNYENLGYWWDHHDVSTINN